MQIDPTRSTPTADPTKMRMTAMMLFCVAVAGALITRAAWLQIGTDSRLENMAKRQFQSKVLIRPRRGLILDRNGEPLAANQELNSLAANPSKIQNKKTIARLLSKATDTPYEKLLKRLQDKNKEFIWIKRHLTEADLNKFKRWKIIDSDGDLPTGLWMVKEAKRVYPHGELAAHLLGDVNVDSEGLEGTELWLNERMRGKVVSMNAIKDALGRPAFIDSTAAKNLQEGKDGEPVSLTIDASLQFAVEEELRNSVRKANAKGGSVIVMNAVTGEILAMANQPSYNPNEKGAPADRRRNRAVTDGYEPGSTMKAILLASALSHGMKLTDVVHGENGSFKVQGKRISEAEAHEKFQWINLKKLIQVSSNVGAAKLALKVGADHYYNTLKNLGFGAKTNTGFPGEISGKVPARKSWQPLTLANIGFGQGVLVTPIQMLRAYAAFLNGGWLVQPTLVRSPTAPVPQPSGAPAAVADSSNPLPPAEPPKRIFSEKVAAGVVEALATVTEDGGTGLKANLPGYRVAGKTGTAQKVDPHTGGYSRSKYIASFIGFAVDVEPKIAIFASVDEPHGVYYASETAAPLFREVLNAVAGRFSLPTKGDVRILAQQGKKKELKLPEPKLTAETVPVLEPADMQVEDMDQDSVHSTQAQAEAKTAAAAQPEQTAVQAAPPTQADEEIHWHGSAGNGRFLWKMPSLRGLTAREAIQVLKGRHFHLKIQGTGVIQSQSPEEGKVIADGDTVRLILAEP